MIKSRTYKMTPLLKKTIKEAINKSMKEGKIINVMQVAKDAIDIIYNRCQGLREPRILSANNIETIEDMKSAVCAYIMALNVDNF